ncbi:organic cation transporter protein isoform X2 [Patella vulgata]|nr:organic cation transporter protein isoform X2 [Patella vulgata]XP_050397877.2 organic cation transporter protein isoform X2 [Patella vulgata]
MLYDDVLKLIGEFGRYQKILSIPVCIEPLSLALMVMVTVFSLATPPHRCKLPGFENDTYHQQSDYHGNLINQSIPQSSSCLLRNTTVDKYGNMTSVEYKCGSWVYDTSTYMSTLVTEFNMVCDDDILRNNAIMITFLGLVFSCSIISNFADRFGRYPVMVISNVLVVTSAYLLVWTPNYIFLVIVRFFVGIGLGGQLIAIFTIGVEIVGPSKRRFTGVLFHLGWCLGVLVIAMLGYCIRNWRYLQLAAAVLTSHHLFYFLMLPESPRWLLTRGQLDKARTLIKKAADINKTIITDDVLLKLRVSETPATAKFWKLCSTRKLTARTLAIYFVWFSVSVTYFGIMLNLEFLVGNIYLNLSLTAVIEVICYIFVMLMVDKSGRKKLICGCYSLQILSLIAVIFILLYVPPDLNWLMTVFTLIGQCGTICSFAIVWLWTSELFPTELRNVGTGTGSASARVGALVAPYLELLSKLVPGRFKEVSPFVFFGIICMVCLVLIVCVLPETNKQKLPDTVDDAGRLEHRSGETRDKDETVEMLGTNSKC